MEDPLPVFFDIAGNTFHFSIEKLAMENLSDSDLESVLQDYRTPQSKGGLSGDVLASEVVDEEDEDLWPGKGSSGKKRKRKTSTSGSSSSAAEDVRDHDDQVREHISEICGRFLPPRYDTHGMASWRDMARWHGTAWQVELFWQAKASRREHCKSTEISRVCRHGNFWIFEFRAALRSHVSRMRRRCFLVSPWMYAMQ